MVNSFGPGNQKIPAKQSHRPKKLDNPLANTLMGGTPAANPMGGAEMDFDMPDMGGMQMNAPSPTGGGDGGYENLMMGMTAINGEQPSGANVIKSPEGPTTAGGWRNELPGIAGMSSMGAQPTGMAGFSGAQSPQVAGWNDPAMGGFQMDTPMMNDPMMGQPDMGGMQMDTPMMNDPMMGGMQMGQPFMGDPVMGQLQGPAGGGAGQQPPPGQPPQGNAPDGWQGEFDENPIAANWQDHQDEYNQNIANKMQPVWDWQKSIYDEQQRLTDEIPGVNVVKNPWDIQQDIIDSAADKTKRSRNSFAGGQAPAGGDALGDALSGGSQADFSEAQVAGPATDSLPITSQFNEEVAPSVSQAPPILDPPVSEVAPTVSLPPTGGTDTPEPAGSTEPVSEGAMQNGKNWDTVDGEYKFMGADYHKQNTRPKADTKDWEETREEAAEDIKEGDKFSEVGDAAYGTASSKSRSVPLEAELPRTGKIHTNRTTMESYNDLGERVDPITGQVIDAGEGGTTGNWGGSFAGTPPPISLPPTQPQTDADYYNKLVNPDKFQNPIIPDLPAGYGHQRVEDGDEFHKFEGREYDVDPKEILTEEGYPVMPSQGIDSNAGGMSVLDTRRFGTTPAQVQALVNNEVANTYQQANQGLGAMTGARPGMSGDIGSYAQQSLGPEVAARMAAGQAQIDIPWQYAMQHADSVRQRRDLAHKLGMEEAGMITGDYYDYLNNLREYGNTDNQITQWAAQQMPDAFG
jgi:hypothetical protein